MKKSSFVAMIMGTVGGIFAAIGMCMCLLPEWNAFKPGVDMGGVGLAALLAMVIVWRRMVDKEPIHLSAKTVGTVVLGIAGIVLLLTLIPLMKGLK